MSKSMINSAPSTDNAARTKTRWNAAGRGHGAENFVFVVFSRPRTTKFVFDGDVEIPAANPATAVCLETFVARMPDVVRRVDLRRYSFDNLSYVEAKRKRVLKRKVQSQALIGGFAGPAWAPDKGNGPDGSKFTRKGGVSWNDNRRDERA